MSLDPNAYRRALGCFATGITVISAPGTDGRPVGMTVNSFTSVSLAPPLVLFCVGNQSRHWTAFQRAAHFAVNVLAEDQEALSVHFASAAPSDWRGVAHRLSERGCALIDGCLVTLECAVDERLDRGDHTVLLGRVEWIGEVRAGRPLVYYGSRYETLSEPDAPCAPAPY